jgi:aarF domain-containing kinase
MEEAAEAAQALVRARKNLQDSESAESVSALSAVHQRGADRLLWLARTNKGVYIKLAQHLAQLDYLLPDEYTTTLRACLRDAPTSSYDDVRRTIQLDFGKPIEELYASFDPVPFASASLAQVHVAYVKQGQDGEEATGGASSERVAGGWGSVAGGGGRAEGGGGGGGGAETTGLRKVAVKVQHLGLRETAVGDVEAVSLVVKLLTGFFPGMPLWWLAEEIAPHLPVELDFQKEAAHAARCRELFKDDASICVPDVLPHLSTTRVLTMSFEEGCSIGDVSAIKEMGVCPGDVAHLISHCFNRQIYSAGFVHCDPHPANVLVRPLPSSSPLKDGGIRAPQLVLLDHGLYRQLDPEFMRDYCILWRALILGQVETIRQQCQKMGAGDMYPLLAAMLTARPWNKIIDPHLDSLQLPDTEEERMMLKQYASHYALDIAAMLNKVPRQMLLLFKANDCLRHVDRRLGSPANTLISTARHTSQALVAHARASGSWRAYVKALCEKWMLELALLTLSLRQAAAKSGVGLGFR